MTHGWKVEPCPWEIWYDRKDTGLPGLRQFALLPSIGKAQRRARLEVRELRRAKGFGQLPGSENPIQRGSGHNSAEASRYGTGGYVNMVKEADEYTEVGQERRRIDQNVEGLIAKFERQSKMIVRVDQHEEHFERLISNIRRLEERIDKLENEATR